RSEGPLRSSTHVPGITGPRPTPEAVEALRERMSRSERPGRRLYVGAPIFSGIPPVIDRSSLYDTGWIYPVSVAPQQVIRALTSRRLPPRQKSFVAIGRYGPTQQVTALEEGRSTYDEDGLRRHSVPAKLRSEGGRGRGRWVAAESATRAAATSASPIRSSATARATSSGCRAGCPTSRRRGTSRPSPGSSNGWRPSRA